MKMEHHVFVSFVLMMSIKADGTIPPPRECDSSGELDEPTRTFDIRAPGIKTNTDDARVCVRFRVIPSTEDQYIIRFEGLAKSPHVHHILLYGCLNTGRNQQAWNGLPVCRGEFPLLLYVWASNASPYTLPKDIGFRIGAKYGVKWLVASIHYTTAFNTIMHPPDYSGMRITVTETPQKYTAGIYYLLNQKFEIPPNTPRLRVPVACNYNGNATYHMFSYLVHTHKLGRVVSAYIRGSNHTQWNLIGKGDPRWPQEFRAVRGNVTLQRGQTVAAMCTYESTNNATVRRGGGHDDEMCNFFAFYYTNHDGAPYYFCREHAVPIDEYPEYASLPLPRNKTLELIASGNVTRSTSNSHSTGRNCQADDTNLGKETEVQIHDAIEPRVPVVAVGVLVVIISSLLIAGCVIFFVLRGKKVGRGKRRYRFKTLRQDEEEESLFLD